MERKVERVRRGRRGDWEEGQGGGEQREGGGEERRAGKRWGEGWREERGRGGRGEGEDRESGEKRC